MSEFKAPPSAQEVAAKTKPAADLARAHEAVFGPGSASLKGPNMPENWRNEEKETAPVDPKFLPDPGEAPEAPVEPEFTEEDKSLFLRSVLSGNPFKKEVVFFGGQMKAVFRTRNASESQEIVQASMRKSDDYMLHMQMELSKGHLAYGLVSLEDETGKIFEYDNGPLEERLARIATFPYPKYSILEKEIRVFDAMVDFFIEKASQPGFWRPVAGTSR